jgi:hypothetical protein
MPSFPCLAIQGQNIKSILKTIYVMKATLVFLVVFGMLVGNLFAGDTNYREFVLREMTPAGDPLPVYNCEGALLDAHVFHNWESFRGEAGCEGILI